jgi:hypothetical protein
MSIHPLAWLSPSRIGGDVQDLLSRTITLARLVMTHLVDDIDGEHATETVAFSYRGVSYETDLSEKKAAALDEVLAPYLANARRGPDQACGPAAPRREVQPSRGPEEGPCLGEGPRHRGF